MAAERYVVLGLATARSAWLREVTRWSGSGLVPVELVRCVSAEDLRARLASGRSWSAVLLDGGTPGVDVDLIAGAGTAVLVVDGGRPGRDWRAMGASSVLPADLTPTLLLDALAAHGRSVASPRPLEPASAGSGTAPVAVVLGPGGTGATTTAAALAQGLAARHDVVLADLALRADQGVLHDAREVAPGVQELVDAHRSRQPAGQEVRDLTFVDDSRGYHLLLGLRHERQWSTLRPRAVEAALEGLRGAFGLVVADVTGDLDGSTADLADRNALARTALRHAHVVLAVGRPCTKGVHGLVRTVAEVVGAGADVDRVLPVVTAAPRHPRQRAELTAVLAELARTTNAPLFLPSRRIEDAWRDARPIPEPLPSSLARAVEGMLDRLPPPDSDDEPVPVQPGSLGVA